MKISSAMLAEDVEGAFDRVSRDSMKESWKEDVSEGRMDALMEVMLNDLMNNTHVQLMLPQEVSGSRWYKTKSGIRQGDNTGPRVFKGEMWKVLKHWSEAMEDEASTLQVKVRYQDSIVDISHSAYVDDTWRLNISWKGEDLILQTRNCKMEFARALSREGMSIHPLKGQCLLQFRGRGQKAQSMKWIPAWNVGEPVESMRLLGSQISVMPNNKEEVNIRLSKFHASCSTFRRFLTNRRVILRWRTMVFKACCVRTLVYSLETRQLGAHEVIRLERAEMKWARKILGQDGYGKLSENHSTVAGKTDDWVRDKLGLQTVAEVPGCALVPRQKRYGP